MQCIILAAGLGSRLLPLTKTTPKPLLPVGGVPLIERNIAFLKEAGVGNIVVVTGHLSEAFNYLSEKHGVKLAFNKDYKKYNNVYSLATALKEIHSTKPCFILEGDGYFRYNIFKEFLKGSNAGARLNRQIDSTKGFESLLPSVYFARYLNAPHSEWQLNTDGNRVIKIQIGNDAKTGGGYVISTAMYLDAKDFSTLVTLLPRYLGKQEFCSYFYDDIVRENISRFNLSIFKPYGNSDIIEIDTLEDYKTLLVNKKRKHTKEKLPWRF